MEYFIIDNGDTIKLGESSFNKFYCEDGFNIIQNMLNDNNPNVSDLIIKRSDNKTINLLQFSKEIYKLIKIIQ